LGDELGLSAFGAEVVERVTGFEKCEEVVAEGFQRGDLLLIEREGGRVRAPRFAGEEGFWSV
jgi:hypothetical protein